MEDKDRWDSLLQWWWQQTDTCYHFTDATWLLAKCQMLQESQGDRYARNPTSGAAGLFQLEPSVSGSLDPLDPDIACQLGIGHLGYLWAMFRAERGIERWKLALASFDCGVKHVLDAQVLCQSRGQATDHWDALAQVLHELTGDENAAETVEYVHGILLRYQQYTVDTTGGAA